MSNDPGCQLSVPGGGAILSIGVPGSSSVSIQPSSNVSFLLLFLRKLRSRPARALEWHSEQQKALALPVWSSSGAQTFLFRRVCARSATTELLTEYKCNKNHYFALIDGNDTHTCRAHYKCVFAISISGLT